MSHGRLPNGNAYCKWYEGKLERRQYFGFGDIALEQARRLDEQKKREKGKIKIEGGLTVVQVCQEYTAQHPVERSTASSDDYRLRSIILPVLGDIQVDALTSAQLNEYVLERLKAGRKKRTVDRELDILRAAFSWASTQEPPLIFRNPLLKFRIVCNDEQVPAPPNTEEIRRILAHAAPHLIRGILIEWYLGTRPGGEVSRITWADVDFEANEIRVIGARKGGPAVRYVQMQDGFRETVRAWREDDEKRKPPGLDIFNLPVVHFRFKPAHSLKKAWGGAKRKAGITRRMRLYDLRHAFATLALKAGADLKAVSEVLGHSRVDTTLIKYQHVSKGQHRAVVDKIPSILLYPISDIS